MRLVTWLALLACLVLQVPALAETSEAVDAPTAQLVDVEPAAVDLDPVGSAALAAFTEGARAGAAEARPVRPRTVNARNRWPDQQAPPPAPGAGRKVRVQAYAYHLGGFTARGTRTRPGTIAVDPRVIPLGSRIYIPGYGWGRAVDTGGAIQGRKIDVWFPTYGQCMQWGIRDLTITVLGP